MLTQLCAAQFTPTLVRLQFAPSFFAEWQGRMSDSRWQIACKAGIAELRATPSSSCLTRFSANLLFLTAPDGQHRRFGGASKTGASRRRDRLGLERSAGLRVRWKRRSLRSPLSIRRNARLRKPLDGGKTSPLLCRRDAGGFAPESTRHKVNSFFVPTRAEITHVRFRVCRRGQTSAIVNVCG